MGKQKPSYAVYLVSCPQSDAEHIAKAVVEKKLAACVQILGPVTSFFWWEEKVQQDTEALLFIKTTLSMGDELKRVVAEIHPYSVPELIGVPVVDGLLSYLEWIDETVSF